MKNKFNLFIFIGIVIFLTSLSYFLSKNIWWKFATKGEIYSSPQLYKESIYFGNNAGRFYSVDAKTGKEKWNFKTGYEIFISPVFDRGRVFFTSSNYLFALDAKTGKELWRSQTEKNYRFITDIKIYKGSLFVGDASGTLYSFNTTGKLRWKVHSKTVSKLSSILIDYWLNWFGRSFEIKDGFIYWGSMDGNLYSLSTNNGKLKWRFDSGETISTSVSLTVDKIYLGNRSGKVFILSRKTGRLIRSWREEKNYVQCLTVSPKKFPWQREELTVSYNNGRIIKKDNQGKTLWNIKREDSGYHCPFERDSTILISNKKGLLTALDSRTGKEKWNFTTNAAIKVDPLVTRVRLIPNVYISDINGVMHALKFKTGKKIWSFKTDGPLTTYPIMTNNYLFLTSTDGGLYKINKFTGKANLPFFTKRKFRVAQEIVKIRENNIVEFTIKVDDSLLTNPWKDASIKTVFSHETGKKIETSGFYYDKDTWKIRFNPPIKGKWRWNLKFELAGYILERNGFFNSTTNTSRTYLKISENNPKRLTRDGKTIFNGLGFQDVVWDFNYNGAPLDDWAIGDSNPVVATNSGEKISFRSDKIVNLSPYLSTYGKGGGFNLYRYIANLWEPSGIHSEFLLNEGKSVDTFLQALKNHDYQIWVTIFGFDIPYGSTLYSIEKKELADYIEYMIARYGAYVSIWEIANEAGLPDNLVKFVADNIKLNDFEKKPISVSWEQPYHDSIDVISPHWYETEPVSESDLRTVQLIDKFSDTKKPVVFGEQGNHILNWDKDSAIRMRIRAWSAFFNEGILIFWNSSEKKEIVPRRADIDFTYGNQYIGEEERGYMKILQKFTNGIDISAKKEALSSRNPEVRGYILVSNKEQLGYLYHYTNQEVTTTTQFELNIPKTGTLIWIDPASGKVNLKQYLEKGQNALNSPPFNIDLAFKIKFE